MATMSANTLAERISSLPPRKILLAAFAGLLVGALLVVLARFVLLPDPTHYHANVGVFINGQQELFESTLYYEKVHACSADEVGPRTRAHLHQPDFDVIHVHEEGVTWGHWFANLGWSLGNDFIRTDTEILEDNDEFDFVFILNGQKTHNIANQVISSEDRLLVGYGKVGSDTAAQEAGIASSAGAI